jgi:hypothetical protein
MSNKGVAVALEGPLGALEATDQVLRRGGGPWGYTAHQGVGSQAEPPTME